MKIKKVYTVEIVALNKQGEEIDSWIHKEYTDEDEEEAIKEMKWLKEDSKNTFNGRNKGKEFRVVRNYYNDNGDLVDKNGEIFNCDEMDIIDCTY